LQCYVIKAYELILCIASHEKERNMKSRENPLYQEGCLRSRRGVWIFDKWTVWYPLISLSRICSEFRYSIFGFSLLLWYGSILLFSIFVTIQPNHGFFCVTLTGLILGLFLFPALRRWAIIVPPFHGF